MAAGTESGGSEPHVFDTLEGHYMVKTRNNPQGERVLVNEVVVGLCLHWLGVAHPRTAIIDVPQDIITYSPSAKFNNGTPLQAGLAFGSELLQSDPLGTIDPSLIANRQDVGATAVCDSWVMQYDGAQHQFRVRASKADPGKYDYLPVDQGFCIGGPGWTAAELDGRNDVPTYSTPIVLSRDDVEGAITLLRKFTSTDATAIVAQVPTDWLPDEERRSLERYLTRRAAATADAFDARFPATPGGTP